MAVPKKILLICLDNMGDLVFTSGAYETMRRSHPNADIGLWCKAYTKHVALLFPGRPKVFASDPFWDASPCQGRGHLLTFLKTMWAIRREGYDCAIVASKNWRSALIAKLLGIKVRVGYATKKSHWFLTKTLSVRQEPAVLSVSRLTTAIGCTNLVPHYELDGRRFLMPHVSSGSDQRTLVVMHPFAGSLSRCWPLEQWLCFATHLRIAGFKLVWVGQDSELKALGQLLTYEQRSELCHTTNGNDSRSLSALLVNATYFVGHDSGPLHLAHSLGAKVLGLYLPGEPTRTYPQGLSQAIIIHRKTPATLDSSAVIAAFQELQKTTASIAKA